MKFFTFIYALYILVLPLFPCMDQDKCNDEKTETCFEKKVDCEENEDEHDEENCSPFCNCMCCGQTMANLFYPKREERNNQNYYSKNTSTYKNTFHSTSYLERIWQPPKIS